MLIGVCSDFFGILIFLLLTASDNKKLNSTLNETFDFAKTRIERYEIYNTNDQVVSTNKQELLSSSVEESKPLYKNEFKAGGMKLSAFIQRPETGMDARRRLKTMMHISFSRKARFTSHEILYV